jgi:hypothetical protein
MAGEWRLKGRVIDGMGWDGKKMERRWKEEGKDRDGRMREVRNAP